MCSEAVAHRVMRIVLFLATTVAWMVVCEEGRAQAEGIPAEVGQDSLELRALSRDRWVMVDSTDVVIRLINHSSLDEINLDSAHLALPAQLECAGRESTVQARISSYDVQPGDSTDLRFPVSAAAEECGTSGRLSAGSGSGRIMLWYTHPNDPFRVLEDELVLRWSAPIWIVAIGAAVGVLAAYLLLYLAKRTGRESAPSSIGPVWAEIAFGVLAATFVVVLLRLLEPDRHIGFLKFLVAESFGHGLILGVTYDTIGHELIGMIRRRNKPASPQPPRPSPTPSPEPV